MKIPLLTTKLFTPPPGPNLISRDRLIEQLNAGLSGKLTLISAPAGFGKSTLLSAWVQQAEARAGVAWLSLDEGDNDLTRFLTYFIAALQTIDTNIGQGVLAALQSPGAVNIEAVLTTLLNEIAKLPDDVVLFLDDYHVIESRPIDKAITFLLNHSPSHMHLVIASRIDPSLPLARLRARGHMIEIRADDLRFTPDEAEAFLKRVMGFELSNQDISALETRTEGWIAGLQLAALSIQGLKRNSDITDFVSRFTGSDRYIQDYLAEEVLQQQSKVTRDFLLQTSILSRLSAPLCDAVRFGGAKSYTEENNSQTILESLEAANLFIVPLDNQRRWFRYHHLFAELLAHYLSLTMPGRITELHQRASIWYESKGYIDDAFHHAQAAGDSRRAADIIEEHWQEIVHRGEMTKLRRILDSLGPEITKISAPLSMAYCWIHVLTGSIETIPGYIEDIRKILKEEAQTTDIRQPIKLAVIPSLVETMEATLALDNKQAGKAKEHAQRAIALIPDDPNPATRGLLQGAASYRLAQAHRELGEFDQACAILLDGLVMLKASNNYIGVANTILQIVSIYQESGKTQEAIILCEDALAYIEEHHWDQMSPSGLVYVVLAGLKADTGDFEAAKKNLEIGRGIVEPVKTPLSISLVDRVAEKLRTITPPPQHLVEPLSPRELEVLQMIAKGLSNREISEQLFLALDTVKGHNRNIYGKLGVKNRAQAVNRAISLQIISPQ